MRVCSGRRASSQVASWSVVSGERASATPTRGFSRPETGSDACPECAPRRALWAISLALLLSGCALLSVPESEEITASAELHDAADRPVGSAAFLEVNGGVRIVLAAHDLPPGVRAVHLHAVGACDGPDFHTAGEIFNPGAKDHGLLNPGGPEAGNLPNITIGPDGTGRLETFSDRVSLRGGPNSVLDSDGASIIVHAHPDDFRTGPDGGSGPAIACGVIVRP